MNKITKIVGISVLLSGSVSFSAYAGCINGQAGTDQDATTYLGSQRQDTTTICGNIVKKFGDGLDVVFSVNGKEIYREKEGTPIDEKVLNDFFSSFGLEVAGEQQQSNSTRHLAIQSRQVTRQTTNMIAQRLSSNISNVFMEDKTKNKLSGSSDSDIGDTAFWGGSNFSQITEDDGEAVHIDNDIYQFVGGFDKAIGDLFFGAALTYAYAENEQIGADSVSNTVGITPYLAYKLNGFMFVSGLIGYNYTGVISPGPDTDIHEYYTEANLNVFKEINSFIFKGRAGVRYNHSFASIKTGLDNSSDELTWIGDVELGYKFGNGLTAYTGVLFEHYDREASGQNSRAYHDGVFYMRWGVDYQIADKLSIGANIETDLNDKSTSLIAGGMNIRLEI